MEYHTHNLQLRGGLIFPANRASVSFRCQSTKSDVREANHSITRQKSRLHPFVKETQLKVCSLNHHHLSVPMWVNMFNHSEAAFPARGKVRVWKILLCGTYVRARDKSYSSGSLENKM